tara:strand:- start:1340 stop:2572 length:1233 start_codon:yes stop_codon:yes gene_type:complete
VAPKPYIVVGRSRDCDLILDDPTVSGRHARMEWRGKNIVVQDLGSANGTFVDGEAIETKEIRPGADLRFGRQPFPWSAKTVRDFLRAGGTDTVLGVSIPGRRFICGSCGTRGLMPAGFTGGVLRCGACSQRLTVSKPKAGWGRVLGMSLSLAALGVGGFLLWKKIDDGSLQSAAERLLPSPEASRSGSPQEASIRVHTLPKVIAAFDATASVTRNTAARIAAQDEGTFRVEQVARIWSHVRGEWRYVNDPHGDEYFAKASETIENEYIGDCDDFAIVLVSMITAVGGNARLVMMDGPQGGHAYAEVCLPEDSDTVRDRLSTHYRRHPDSNIGDQRVSSIHYRPGLAAGTGVAPVDETCGVWLNLDWNAGVPGGIYEPERWAVAIYPNGNTETLAPAADPDAEVTQVGSPP